MGTTPTKLRGYLSHVSTTKKYIPRKNTFEFPCKRGGLSRTNPPPTQFSVRYFCDDRMPPYAFFPIEDDH